jgi:hypothetical protein
MCTPPRFSENSTRPSLSQLSPEAFGNSSVTFPPLTDTMYVAQLKFDSEEVNAMRDPSGVNTGVALPSGVFVSRTASRSAVA